MRKTRLRDVSGITLIELLIVVAIVAILAAIMIPQYAVYRRQSYEAQVKADLRNAAVAEEAAFVAANSYKACSPCTSADLAGYKNTPSVSISSAAGASAFTLTATHRSCNAADHWTYESDNGAVVGGPCT